MSSESRIAQFKAALGKKVPVEEAKTQEEQVKPPFSAESSSASQQSKKKTPARRGGRTRRRNDKDEELARTSALKRFEYQPKTAEQRSSSKPPVQTVAGTEVFLEEKDKLAEERRKMIDSVVQKVMNKQLKDKGFAKEITKRPASSGDEGTMDASAGHPEPVRPPSLPNTFGMFNNGKRSKTVEAAKRPRISLAFDEDDFFDKSKTIVCDTTLGVSAPPKKKAKSTVACQAATPPKKASKSLTSETIGVADLLESCRQLMVEQDKLVHAFENESALLPSSAEISAAIERELESSIGWVAQTNLRRSQEQMPYGWQSTHAWFSLPRRSPRSTLQDSLLWTESAGARSPVVPPTPSHRFMSPSSSARPLLGSFGGPSRLERGEDGGEPARLTFKTSPQLLL